MRVKRALRGGAAGVSAVLTVGDWREEVVYPNASSTELIIFTTNQPTGTRLYTLAHNRYLKYERV